MVSVKQIHFILFARTDALFEVMNELLNLLNYPLHKMLIRLLKINHIKCSKEKEFAVALRDKQKIIRAIRK